MCLVSAGQAQQFKLITGLTISHYSAEWPYYGIVAYEGAHLNPFENRKIGFMVGCGVEVALNKIVSFELDGFYFQKGSAFEHTYPWFYSSRFIHVLNGLSIPFLFKFRLPPVPFLYALAGPEFSYFTAHALTRFYQYEGSEWMEWGKESLIDETRRFDFGPVVGLGFEARLRKVSLFLETRYSIGLVNMPVHRSLLGHDPKISSLVVLTGIRFN